MYEPTNPHQFNLNPKNYYHFNQIKPQGNNKNSREGAIHDGIAKEKQRKLESVTIVKSWHDYKNISIYIIKNLYDWKFKGLLSFSARTI